jgi:7,8-dihydropterin-6-yl-methyl-4-(beta-D-ribofuranosyl)aminobenzene 5'-phosphate synthase
MEIVGRDIALVFGGFHLMRMGDERIRSIVEDFRKLGVARVGPSHCTGEKARNAFKEEYGEDFLSLGVGYEFRF